MNRDYTLTPQENAQTIEVHCSAERPRGQQGRNDVGVRRSYLVQQPQLQRRPVRLQRRQTDSSQVQSHYAVAAAVVVTAVSETIRAASESGEC